MRRVRVAGLVLLGVVALLLLLRGRAREDAAVEGVARNGAPAAETEATLRGAGTEDPASPASESPATEPEAAASGDGEGPWVVEGRVVDLHRRPLAGVPVVSWTKCDQRTVSGEDGTFTWETEQVSVHLQPGAGWEGMSREATRAKPQVTLQAIRVLSLGIRVRDAAGRPLPNVTGTFHHSYTCASDGDSVTWSLDTGSFGPTDEEGRSELRLAAPTDSLRLEVVHEEAFAREDVAFPFRREVVLRLAPRCTISAAVFDREGRRLEVDGALVAQPLDPGGTTIRSDGDFGFWDDDLDFLGENDGDEEDPEAVEKPPRRFSLGVPGAGPWLVHFEPRPIRLADSDPVRVTAPCDDVSLVCPPAVSISGRVLDVGSTRFNVTWLPSPGADGRTRDASSAVADADGAFVLFGLAPGPGRLCVHAPDDDRFGLLEDVEAPLEGARIRLETAAPLVARMAGFEPPAGLEGASLWVRALDGDLAVAVRASREDPGTTGDEPVTFRLRGLPPGRYELSWRWRNDWGGNGPWVPFGVTVEHGANTPVVLLPAPR